MLDKEFDKQVKDRFKDFEIEPSPLVWEGISREVAGKSKKPFPVFWFAAASMAAVLAVIIWLAPEKETIRLYGKTKLAADTMTQAVSLPQNRFFQTEEETEQTVFTEPQSAVAEPEKVEKEEQRLSVSTEYTVKQDWPEEQTSILASSPSSNQAANVEAVVVAQVPQKIEHSEAVSVQSLAETDSSSAPAKNKIKTVGDLVNFVVSRVDKRKNKLIEFSKDDEGEEISGLNLGFLKYRTRNN